MFYGNMYFLNKNYFSCLQQESKHCVALWWFGQRCAKVWSDECNSTDYLYF